MYLLFFTGDREVGEPVPAGSCEVGTLEVWTPSLRRLVPRGLPIYPFAIFWFFHHLRIFKNRQYKVILIRHQGQVVHCSTVVPCYFRFPFMRPEDVQIGVWTEPESRGLGLTGFALRKAIELTRGSSRRIWYIVKQPNPSSVRVAEKLGLVFAGRGIRVSRFGLRILGKFVPEALGISSQRENANEQDPIGSQP